MAISSLSLDPSWRDYTGVWNALVEPLMAPIEESRCHAPRFVLIPDQQAQVISASGKIEYNFRLVPGSLLLGMWTTDAATAVQLKDLNIGHEFFQEPMNPQYLQTLGAEQGRFPSFFLFPAPHPVVGDGLFMLEAWGPAGNEYFAVLQVAEVTDCPVR